MVSVWVPRNREARFRMSSSELEFWSTRVSDIPFQNHTSICTAGKFHPVCWRPLDIPNSIRITPEVLYKFKGRWCIPALLILRRIYVKILDCSILACREKMIAPERADIELMDLSSMFPNATDLETISVQIVYRYSSIPTSSDYGGIQGTMRPFHRSDIELFWRGGR